MSSHVTSEYSPSPLPFPGGYYRDALPQLFREEYAPASAGLLTFPDMMRELHYGMFGNLDALLVTLLQEELSRPEPLLHYYRQALDAMSAGSKVTLHLWNGIIEIHATTVAITDSAGVPHDLPVFTHRLTRVPLEDDLTELTRATGIPPDRLQAVLDQVVPVPYNLFIELSRSFKVCVTHAAQALLTLAEDLSPEEQEARRRLFLDDKLRALRTMAGGIAHDFNNVLGAVLGNSQLLRKKLEGRCADLLRYTDTIERVAASGAATVKRLLTLTSSEPTSEFIAIDLHKLLRSVITDARSDWHLEHPDHAGKFAIMEDFRCMPFVNGNSAEIQDACLHIIMNSLEAIRGDGQIVVRLDSQPDTVIIEIKDDGPGMPAEVLKQAFDPFFTTKGPKRSGLGLSVAYGLIFRHGGDIVLESEPGSGTTVRVMLPLAETHAAERRQAPSSNIMVVEDEDAIREMLVEVLTERGYVVEAYSTGEEALDHFAPGRFCMLLIDLGLPSISGWEVSREAKRRDPGVIAVVMTGWDMKLPQEQLTHYGVSALLAKPFQLEELLRLINEKLEIRN